MAASDAALAAAIARAVSAFDSKLIVFGPPGSALLGEAAAVGLRVAAEGFGDRAYEPDGHLVSRQRPHAVIHDPASVVSRVVQMVKDRTVTAVDGTLIPLMVDTICIHSDTAGADVLAAALRAGLEAAGIGVAALSSPGGVRG
jgi:UPF0271 protein